MRQTTEFECDFAKSILYKKLTNLCNGKIIVNSTYHTVTLKFPVKCSCKNQLNHSALSITNHTEIEKDRSFAFKRLPVKEVLTSRQSYLPTVMMISDPI